jgi:hypothetical protein
MTYNLERREYVAGVYSKCFICFRRMLQVFYLDIAYVAVTIHILQAFVPNVSSVSVVCCSTSFMLHVQTVGVGDDKGGRAKPRPPTQERGVGCAAPVWKRLARFLSRGVRRSGGDWCPTRPCGDWVGGGGESSEQCGMVPHARAKTVPARVARESKWTNGAGPNVRALASWIFLWQYVVRDPVMSYFETDFHHVVFGCPAQKPAYHGANRHSMQNNQLRTICTCTPVTYSKALFGSFVNYFICNLLPPVISCTQEDNRNIIPL